MTKLKNKNDKIFIDKNKSLDIENVIIEEIDKDINDFYIDKEKFENIKVPEDINILIKEAIDKAQEDISKEQKESKQKSKIVIVASITVILCIGIYNPVLAHDMPPVYKVLDTINDVLKVDEIAHKIGLDKIIPKAILDENGNIKFKRLGKSNLPKELMNQNSELKSENLSTEKNQGNLMEYETQEKYIEVYEEDVYYPQDEESTKNLIHEMANGIIHAIDDRKLGYTEISPKTIEIAIESLNNISSQEDKNYLNRELNKWKDGNFDNVIEVHNYRWNLLNGEVGEAGSLDYDEIQKIKDMHFKE